MEKYTAQNIEDIVPIVAKYGIAILENVLDEEECKVMFSQAWDFFEELYPVLNRNDPSTWKNIHDLKPLHGMLFQHWGIGHAQYIWNLRMNPKIINIYKIIWSNILEGIQIDELKVSFDGASFGVPPEDTNKGWNGNDWFHVDQRFPKASYDNIECIQSWVTSENVGPDDATLSILEGSNQIHSKVGLMIAENLDPKNRDDIHKNDWYKFNKDELSLYKDCPRVDIQCKAGSMVFWDSRTVHCGRGPIKNRLEKNFRNVVYLCYIPSSMVNYTIKCKRIRAYKDLRTTSHWPNKAKFFPKMPRIYGKDYIKPELMNYKKIKPVIKPEYEYLI